MQDRIARIRNARQYLLRLIDGVSSEKLNEIPDGFNNNIIWNIGHLISAQQSICYLRAKLQPTVDSDILKAFQPSSKPQKVFSVTEITTLKTLFVNSIDDFERDFSNQLFDQYQPWVAKPYGMNVDNIVDAMDFLMYHDGLHAGYVMAMRRLL